ncbi:oxidoreductase [Falsihalocynthiibacter sp. SS001]|uniref:oxidoreductase n=1 Tax=Falsihalocynthiibacter sp. SS001 TaxID=3349698 RepID=UPI0036D3A669
MNFTPIFRFFASGLLAISLTGPTYAGQEPKLAKEEIVLTVSGQAILGNDEGGSAAFSIDMLRALPQVTFKTSTQWTEGVDEFTGTPLGAFIAEIADENPPATLRARAANDYSISIPVPEADEPFPIIAYEMNGRPMSVREKGPLWIIYPFDSDKDFQSATILSRSVWQVVEIELSTEE